MMEDAPLKKAVFLYGLSESELRPMRGGHFAQVYSFQRAGQDYVLRLTPPDKDVDERTQRFLLAWLSYLAAHGASVPAPLASQQNHLIEIIHTDKGEWMATAFTKAQGILSEELPVEQWDAALFRALGRAIGRTHAIAQHYVPPEGVKYCHWDDGGSLFNRRIQNEDWLMEKQARLLERIRTLPRSPEAYGLIHGDLHFGNFYIHVPGRVITLIDFDDCAYGWFSMDIAELLFDILVLYPGTDKEGYARNFLQAFLAGYLPENPLSGFWLEQIPLFLKLLEINVYDSVAKFYPDDTGEWGSKFMPGRKERIEKELPYVDLDFRDLHFSHTNPAPL